MEISHLHLLAIGLHSRFLHVLGSIYGFPLIATRQVHDVFLPILVGLGVQDLQGCQLFFLMLTAGSREGTKH